MAKVTKETKAKLKEYINTLSDDVSSKCTLCNETLTDCVKKAEVKTGAPTATVARALAEKVNEGAVEGDKVNGKALMFRVRNHEGRRKVANGNNKPYTRFNETIKEAEEDNYDWTDNRTQEFSHCISNVISSTIKRSSTPEYDKMFKDLQGIKIKPDFEKVSLMIEGRLKNWGDKLKEDLEQYAKVRESLKSIT
jgi:hypothetical protein